MVASARNMLALTMEVNRHFGKGWPYHISEGRDHEAVREN